MTGVEIILACSLFIMTVIAGIAIYFAVKFGVLILSIEDAIEESLDVLDERYMSISEVIEIPLFSDSPQIRQVHFDLRRSREAILSIAHILVDDFNRLEDIEDGEDQKKNT